MLQIETFWLDSPIIPREWTAYLIWHISARCELGNSTAKLGNLTREQRNFTSEPGALLTESRSGHSGPLFRTFADNVRKRVKNVRKEAGMSGIEGLPCTRDDVAQLSVRDRGEAAGSSAPPSGTPWPSPQRQSKSQPVAPGPDLGG